MASDALRPSDEFIELYGGMYLSMKRYAAEIGPFLSAVIELELFISLIVCEAFTTDAEDGTAMSAVFFDDSAAMWKVNVLQRTLTLLELATAETDKLAKRARVLIEIRNEVAHIPASHQSGGARLQKRSLSGKLRAPRSVANLTRYTEMARNLTSEFVEVLLPLVRSRHSIVEGDD